MATQQQQKQMSQYYQLLLLLINSDHSVKHISMHPFQCYFLCYYFEQNTEKDSSL